MSEINNIVTSSYLNNSSLPCELIMNDPPKLRIQLKDSNLFYFDSIRLAFFEKEKL